jgi:hypothetical protein
MVGGIGYQSRKYQAEKAAKAEREALALIAPPVVPVVEDVDPPPEEEQVSMGSEPAVTQTDFLGAMKLLLEEIRASNIPSESKERLALEAERLSLEQERLKREMPENKQAPGISVYSYPEGDLAHPKPDLKCQILWIGYELNTDTLTPQEVDLLNRLQPGDFRVTKMDGTQIPFKVEAKYGDKYDPITQRPEVRQLAVWFPCKAVDQRQNHASMVQYLQQALGDKVPSNTELLAEVAQLRAQLAQASA